MHTNCGPAAGGVNGAGATHLAWWLLSRPMVVGNPLLGDPHYILVRRFTPRYLSRITDWIQRLAEPT